VPDYSGEAIAEILRHILSMARNQSLPRQSGPPVGLMLVTRGGHDHRLFGNAAAIERLFAA
jgi:Asp-tRNA(Asn)/Glu-tRNA(Gln) amidotransferase A subunit family amidase